MGAKGPVEATPTAGLGTDGPIGPARPVEPLRRQTPALDPFSGPSPSLEQAAAVIPPVGSLLPPEGAREPVNATPHEPPPTPSGPSYTGRTLEASAPQAPALRSPPLAPIRRDGVPEAPSLAVLMPSATSTRSPENQTGANPPSAALPVPATAQEPSEMATPGSTTRSSEAVPTDRAAPEDGLIFSASRARVTVAIPPVGPAAPPAAEASSQDESWGVPVPATPQAPPATGGDLGDTARSSASPTIPSASLRAPLVPGDEVPAAVLPVGPPEAASAEIRGPVNPVSGPTPSAAPPMVISPSMPQVGTNAPAVQREAAVLTAPRAAAPEVPQSRPNPTPARKVTETPRRQLPRTSGGQRDALQPPNSSHESVPADAFRNLGATGLGVRIEQPQAGTTAQGVQPLVGQLSGGGVRGVIVYLNGEQQLLDVWGTRFEGEVALRPGRNQIRAVAMGPRGAVAESSVEVQYVPPAPSSAVQIVRPTDGTVLDPAGPDAIEVGGVATGPATGRARVVFNGFTIPLDVRDGRFSVLIPKIAPELTIWAEMGGGPGSPRSSPITIREQSWKPAMGYVLLYLPTPAGTVDARVWLSHRPDPADFNGPRKVLALPLSGGVGAGQTSMLFPFRQTRRGAYTLALDYRLPPGESVERGWGLIFVPGARGYRALRLGPFSLSGKGRAVLARFLLPYGVFWDEDSWFNGAAEGAESVTKFRYSDGVSWTERKGEPEFPDAK